MATGSRGFGYCRLPALAAAESNPERQLQEHFDHHLAPKGHTWGGMFTDKASKAELRHSAQAQAIRRITQAANARGANVSINPLNRQSGIAAYLSPSSVERLGYYNQTGR